MPDPAAFALLGLFFLAQPSAGAQRTTTAFPTPARSGPIVLWAPRGNGTPVITDGIFCAGEWDDARRLPLNPTTELRVKEYRAVVFIGLRGSSDNAVGPSELFLTVPGGPVHVFHVSYQLGESVLPAEGKAPPFRFGLTSEWYANELRRDMEESARMQKEGRPPIDIIKATSYPCDGIEFAIRRSKLPGSIWLMRLAVSVMTDGKPGFMIYPEGAAERSTSGWLTLQLDRQANP